MVCQTTGQPLWVCFVVMYTVNKIFKKRYEQLWKLFKLQENPSLKLNCICLGARICQASVYNLSVVVHITLYLVSNGWLFRFLTRNTICTILFSDKFISTILIRVLLLVIFDVTALLKEELSIIFNSQRSDLMN